MQIRILLLLIAALGFVACSTQEPQIQTGPDAEVILGNLHRVDHTRAALVFRDPNADFSVYSKIVLDPLDLNSVEIVQPSRSVTARGKWELNESDKEKLANAFREVFVRELEETGDYQIVAAPGPDVLRITATITAIAPNASKDDFNSRAVGRSRVYTEGAGSMAIAFGFSDSKSGELLALVKDARTGSPTWSNNNSVSNMSDVRFMFGGWARQIRARLDIVKGY